MADTNVDQIVIKKTQESLGKYVKKPALSEKLLRKPPFRFLLDILAAVIKETGYFDGLYTPEEFDKENTNDRDSKMKFLQKMIDVTRIVTKAPISVRASKIVAGQEPEKTNQLLQLIAEILDKKLDWRSGVEQVINKGQPSLSERSKPKIKEKKIEKSDNKKKESDETKSLASGRNSEKLSPAGVREKSKKQIKENVNSGRKGSNRERLVKEKPKPRGGKESSNKEEKIVSPVTSVDSRQSVVTEAAENVIRTAGNAINKNVEKPKIPENVATTSEEKTEIATNEMENVEQKPDNNLNAPDLVVATNLIESPKSSTSQQIISSSSKSTDNILSIEKPTSSMEPVVQDENIIQKTETEAPNPIKLDAQPTVTNDSNRKTENSRKPSITSRPRTSLRPPSARPASARPGAPRRYDKNVEIILQPNDQIKVGGANVKLETFNADLEDDGENLVIIEDPNAIDFESNNEYGSDVAIAQGKGHLVQQILETQKELVQSNIESEEKREKELEGNTNSIKSLRGSSANYMVTIRDIVENLTKNIRPFGKLMEFIPEDIDAMQLEWTMWRDAYTQAAIELQKEKTLIESTTEPMKNQLIQLDLSIKEYQEIIDASRVKILQNSEKILKLLQE